MVIITGLVLISAATYLIARTIKILIHAKNGYINEHGVSGCDQGCLYISVANRDFIKLGLSFINFIRGIFDKTPIWLFPPFYEKIGDYEVKINEEELSMSLRTFFLYREMKRIIKQCPIDQKLRKPLISQSKSATQNMQNAIWKLYRIRRIKGLIKDRRNDIFNEAQELEDKLLATMNATLNSLAAVPILVMKVELEDQKTRINQVLFELKNRNQELRTLAFSKRNAKL